MAELAFNCLVVLVRRMFPIAHIGMAGEASTRVMALRLFGVMARLTFHHPGMGKLVRGPIVGGVAFVAITGEVVGIQGVGIGRVDNKQ